ncbi:pyridoxamine 5'-phosphate oxidase family protein [Kitasatospora sp. NPDC002227]|uniref:pyridoxamine 5'-phosphate oxidase family protein n=1 Tax=Kitasatospora sp. NPDC002227 TaxID=3154773 RepID=UPI0033287CAF
MSRSPATPAAPVGTPLAEVECLRLLARASVGRVVYTVGALPAVLPVRYHLGVDASVLFRAPAGSELVRAVSGALVAFEVGELSGADGSGWSVTVLGRADLADDPPHAPAEDVMPHPGEEPGRVWIRIRPELVTGHRLAETAAPG